MSWRLGSEIPALVTCSNSDETGEVSYLHMACHGKKPRALLAFRLLNLASESVDRIACTCDVQATRFLIRSCRHQEAIVEKRLIAASHNCPRDGFQTNRNGIQLVCVGPCIIIPDAT